jgi:hypothetical protein
MTHEQPRHWPSELMGALSCTFLHAACSANSLPRCNFASIVNRVDRSSSLSENRLLNQAAPAALRRNGLRCVCCLSRIFLGRAGRCLLLLDLLQFVYSTLSLCRSNCTALGTTAFRFRCHTRRADKRKRGVQYALGNRQRRFITPFGLSTQLD